MKKVELLSPAGNFACLKAAVNNGADAVYLGGKNFSARAFANNFDKQELLEAIEYAHLRNVRIFVTLNTLLNEKELNNALAMADFYYQSGVDALLIQDLGLYYVLKERYPDFELHCSTQMHVHNLQGVLTARKLGFKRVVLARESDLQLIKSCCDQGIEVEVFVHGAICVSYSGQCLMSSFSKKRSANKGMCAQSCRLKYELYKDGNKLDTDTDYLLSPKDMCLIDDIPELIKAGVSSFKIEGRMKSSAYVGYVTRLYRKAIDEYYAGRTYRISQEELRNLRVLFNRNFTDDLLKGRNDLFGQKTPNHLGIQIGDVLYNRNDLVYIRLSDTLNQFDGIRINEWGCIVNRLYKDGLLVNKAEKGDIVAIEAKDRLKGPIFKTQDHLLEQKINDTDPIRLPLDISLEIYAHKPVTITLKCFDDICTIKSEIIAQEALKAPLNEDTVTKQFSKLNETPYYLHKLELKTDKAFLAIKDLNEIRRNAIEIFNKYRLDSFKREIIPCEVEYRELKENINEGIMIRKGEKISLNDQEFTVNEVINPSGNYSEDERAVICEFGGLLKEYKEKIAYFTLNVSNSYAYEFLNRLGFEHIVVSSELNDNEISDLIESYRLRNKLEIRPYRLTKGELPLMYIKAQPFAKYIDDKGKYQLHENENRYDISFKDKLTILSLNIQDCQSDHPFLPLVIEKG